MDILEALQEVRKLTHKRNQGIVYQLADVKEAIFKLADVVEAAYEETGPAVRDVLAAESVSSRRWKLYPDYKYQGQPSDDWVVAVSEHCKVRYQREKLLGAIQSIQKTVWPNDTELFGVSEEAPFEDLDNFVGTIKDEFKKLREQVKDAREGREDVRRAMLAQRQRPPAPDMYVGRGRYDAAVAERTLLQERLRNVWNIAHTLAEGIRLTQEYVGDDGLPPRPGWAWYDALVRYRNALGLDLGDADEGVDFGDEDAT